MLFLLDIRPTTYIYKYRICPYTFGIRGTGWELRAVQATMTARTKHSGFIENRYKIDPWKEILFSGRVQLHVVDLYINCTFDAIMKTLVLDQVKPSLRVQGSSNPFVLQT